MKSLAVWSYNELSTAAAIQIAEQLSAPLLPPVAQSELLSTYNFLLRVDESGISLLQGKSVITVDFVAGANHHRRLHGGGRSQAIAKAIGLKSGNRVPSVLDCTAGLARDAFVLASLACNVQMCERSPLVYLLLQDGLKRAASSDDSSLCEIINRMHLLSVDAKHYMLTMAEEARPDVVYLDPMFPEKRKTSAVKKDMAAFHVLVGADQDADSLLPLALEVARYRVVVKRPRHAPHLDGCKPGLMLEGDSTRFDIYPLRSMSLL